MVSWKQLVLLIVFGSIMFAGVATSLVTIDHDHHYSLDEELSERPSTYPMPYEDLPASEQARVDAAIEGKSLVFQTRAEVPPQTIEKDGTYYTFNYRRSFDWTDPGTAVPVAVFLFGFGGVVTLVRRDIRRQHQTQSLA